MLPTFVIGLREGLEAALIVGIIAAFLRKQGRRDLLRWVLLGVAVAILLCVGAGIALNAYSKDLPQKQQEGLETIIGVLAVGMVTYMVMWMKRHSRDLKGQLEGLTADALGGSSGAARAMVAMAFLAVLREGIETVIFLLAAFNQSTAGSGAAAGAALGIAVAMVLGYGIYRGGVHINLSKFFRATGLVLVAVAAGLVVNALHTAHEAGWVNVGQGNTIDLTWLVRPGSVQSSLLTGMLGVQNRPVVIEVVGWLIYLVPVAAYVAWPPGRSPARRSVSRALLGIGAVLAVTAAILAPVAPDRPASRPVTAGDRVLSMTAGAALVRVDGREVTVHESGGRTSSGVEVDSYTGQYNGTRSANLPTTLTFDRIAELNGGSLPIGLRAGSATDPVRYSDVVTTTVAVEPRTGRIVDVRSSERVNATVVDASRGSFALSRPVASTSGALPAATAQAAVRAAAADVARLDRRTVLISLAWTAAVFALVALLAGAALAVVPRRRPVAAPKTRVADLVRS